MSRHLIASLLFLGPGTAFAVDDIVTEAPQRSYRIIQHYVDGWNSTLHFPAPLGASWLVRDADAYPAPAVFQISPDDAWILGLQKTASGDMWAWLYHVGPRDRVWRLEERLDEIVFDYLVEHEHLFRADVAPITLEFLSWDTESRALRFRFSCAPKHTGQSPLDRQFSYHLDSHELTH